MNTSKILNLLLALALVILSVKVTFYSDNNGAATDNKISVLENIYSRTSIRAYQQKEVDDSVIEQILKAGTAAPTAGNKQPWTFIVVKDKSVLKTLGDKLPYAKMTAEAPFAIVACGDLRKTFGGEATPYWIQDVSAATENMLLAAHALGLGAVWTGVHPIKERERDVQDILNLPEYIIPLGVIPMGYPAEDPAPKNKWKPENIHYDSWQENEQQAKNTPSSPTANKWEKVTPQSLKENPFTLFKDEWMLLAAGKKGNMNAMTIGWGNLGTLWGSPVVTVYVEKSRYTHSFMERNEYFTVTAFPEQHREALKYMGTHSGRDGDKIKAAKLTTEFTDLGNPIFEEGRLVIECKKIYGAPFDPTGFGEKGKEVYKNRQLHSVYVGEIVNVWIK